MYHVYEEQEMENRSFTDVEDGTVWVQGFDLRGGGLQQCFLADYD